MRQIAVGQHVRWIESKSLCAVVILVLSAASYLNSLNGEFVWDDVAQVRDNPFVRDLGNLPHFFTVDIGKHTAYPGFSPYYRPLFLVSYAIDYSLWGLNPSGFHLTNIALHAMCSLLVYVTTVRLLENSVAAFIAAAVFAVHPVHAEAVAWIAGRADLLAALFVFSGFYFYTRFRDTGKRLLLAASLLASGLAFLSKEAAICMPLVIMAYEYFRGQDTRRQAVARTLLWSGPFILIAGLYFTLRTAVMGSIVLGHPDAPPITAGRIYTTIVTVFDYVRLFLFPINLKVLYHVPIKDSPSSVDILLFLLGLFVLVGALVLAHARDRKLFFGSLWFLIAVMPVLGPAGLVIMADRYLYIPSLGLCLAAGVLLARLYYSRMLTRYHPMAIALPLAILFLLTWQRNATWKDEFTYFKRAVEDAPRFAMARNNLGKWYLDRKMRSEAALLFKEAIALDPTYAAALVNLGTAYYEMGLRGEAIAEYRKAIQRSPGSAEAYYNLGNVYLETGRMEDAITQWKKAVAVKPEHSEANNNLGNIYLMRGNYPEAARRYAIALRGRPLNVEANYNLAMVLEKQGDLKAAIPQYEKFLTLAPEQYKSTAMEIKRKLERLSNPATERTP